MRKVSLKKGGIALVFVFVLSLGFSLTALNDANGWARGKWYNVYAGQITPQYKECVSALANKCVTGDIRSLE